MRIALALGALTALAVIVSCSSGGGGNSADWDVRGNYALTYDDQLKLTLNVGGGVREATATGYGQIVDFGTWQGQPLKLDLTQFCAKPEVKCPSETFWSSVSVDQQDLERKQDLHVINVINNTEHTLPAGQRAEVRGGLVDHTKQGQFLIGLGAESGGNDSCGALGVSLAGGRFNRVGETTTSETVYRDELNRPCSPDAGTATDAGLSSDGGVGDGGTVVCTPRVVNRLVVPAGAPVEGIKDGKVFIGWFGACAFGPIVAGATLTLETGFTGKRTGQFDPPPFTPAPAVLPDGGVDAGF